jgi:hypothetical protein
MSCPDGFFLWIARWDGITGLLQTVEVITNMMCSAADILFVFCFLRIADVAREEEGRPKIRLRYRILPVFLFLTPALLFFKGPALMVWTSLILGIPYLLLAWSVVTDVGGIVRLLRRRIRTPLKRP